ncbi:MAG TPA: lytic transglycosylase domain-containing protein [Thermoanaerobaculia bacterium]|nr:lytic transglycosylase domain-containing protein [Thermoanaerobaculia bacterium]
MARKRLALYSAAAFLLLLAIVALVLQRQRVRRHRVFRPAAGEAKPAPMRGVPPVEQWTETFQQLQGEELVELLEAIEQKHPDLYAKWSLAYLHARALVDENETTAAAAKLAPFLAKAHPFRDRALYHRASIAEGAEASRFRNVLIFEHRDSPYRDEAIDEEIEYLADNAEALTAFAEKIAPSASTERRREISARIVEATGSFERGLRLLNAGTSDDAADRVARALDKPEVLAKLSVEQLALFGETFQAHRHYDRAIALLLLALKKAYSDDLQFALGRSYFGAEKYTEAQAAYLRGAGITKKPEQQCTFFWHAARAAQLRGDDRVAEELMTRAIAVKGTHPATLPALTQRLRTRLKARRFAEAGSDLALLRKIAPKDRAVLEGSLAYATGMLAAGKNAAALSALNSVKSNEPELAYWRARAKSDPDAYLDVLRSQSHFAYFARARVKNANLTLREAQVKNLIAAKKFELAKRIQTDRVLLSPDAKQLKILENIYRQLPAYAAMLDLKPAALPRFPNVKADDPDALLMAMGLHDEAISAIENRWGLRPQSDALTRAYALHLAGASKPSIYAIEVMMKSVPSDFHPDLLPELVSRLLYPRYFYGFIAADAASFETDPTLLLAIMREESRFNPRAKSQAAARGLLQFIITTARDIGRDVGLVDLDPEDLYDPRVIIRLGAKYTSELGEEFDGNRYRIAAAYNAGPRQVALWNRMQSAPGDDYFLTAVNFDETKGYVNKVMNSYERYRAIY